ncbi:SDR family NAD(P)-dependent oxidoreductase [Massilia sp. CCM 8695]|uniref:SDR family NAD(P)-dependent oxidoreductase n=1 Tax=Massilia frigida TaxID=2609281 RepID=A0ABX0N9X2_9BURK|nr:SDR family NAD(P)-dependent oxidoreductase [Massilia frigida]NHZ79649.1 SDR family NAD(P)-dependent oxidoreductase [Massilia frigida]
MGMLDGRTALVTGGSRGLGRALCMALAREGANVAFNYTRSVAEAEAVLAALKALGVKAWAFQVSVLDKAGLQAMVRTIEQDAGAIDILINNAGIGQVVPLALMEEEDWDRMMNTNVKGAFLTTQAVLRGMIHQKRGRILNISSLAGVKMMQAPVHYSAAKAALKGMTEALAKEVGRYGITVNCLAPGVLDEGVSGNVPAAKMSEYLRHCALGRLGTVDEVAEAAAFFVSDKNSYMSGATVVIDGAV